MDHRSCPALKPTKQKPKTLKKIYIQLYITLHTTFVARTCISLSISGIGVLHLINRGKRVKTLCTNNILFYKVFSLDLIESDFICARICAPVTLFEHYTQRISAAPYTCTLHTLHTPIPATPNFQKSICHGSENYF